MIEIQIVKDCRMFQNIPENRLDEIFSNAYYTIKKYKSGEEIAKAGSICSSAQIVLKGFVRAEMVDYSGRIMTIDEMGPAMSLAIAFLFGSNNRYPVDVIAVEDSELLVIPRDSLLKILLSERQVLLNFLDMVSNKTQFLSERLRFVSFKSLKGKIAHFILEMEKKQGSDMYFLQSQQQIADFLGVARPSFARTLAEMQTDGVLKINRKKVEIINREKLIMLTR